MKTEMEIATEIETETVTSMSTVSASGVVNDLRRWKYSFWGSCLGSSEGERMYQEFMSNENSWYIHVGLCLFGTIFNLVIVLQACLGDFPVEFQLFAAQRVVLLLPLWLYFYAISQKKYPCSLRPLPINMTYLGDAVLLLYAVSFGTYLYGLATADGCDLSPPPPHLMCEDHVPLSGVILYVTVSLTLSVVTKCRHVGVVILSIVIEICFLSIIVSIKEPTSENVLAITIVLVAQCLFAFDNDVYSRRIYQLLVEARSTMHAKIMTENDKVVMEMQSTELRFLIGNVAHDLKTPLQALTYELDLMKSRSAAQEGKESILLLESICSFMQMTINRAIDYTKVTSGIQLKPSMETVNVVEVYDWVKMCVARTMSAGSVSIVLEPFPQDLCKCIITDKQWLVENLLCLISNAQKFTAHGDIRIRYSSVSNGAAPELGRVDGDEVTDATACESPKPPNMVMVEVIDDGIGISEEMQRTLFKPFKQAMRRAGGTGLGIYSLSKRVQSLGGTCGVSSRADGKSGARFWFTLPYRPDFTTAAAETSLRSCPSSVSKVEVDESPSLNSVRGESSASSSVSKALQDGGIMLVEDSPLIQKTCARSLLREGITVDIANNGLECVEKVMTAPGQYTVLLMDVNMPVMDGLEATQRIRQWERARGDYPCQSLSAGDIESDFTAVHEIKKLLIIGVSANSDSVSKQEALDAGMDHFISKPLKISALRACLTELNLDLDMFAAKA